jgi:peptidyl-prolyl cis-trans isomerase B (cyclophilin B)
VIRLDTARAPCTANSMRSLAHFRYFDHTRCHRLTTQGIYILQCGDPTGTGTGGPGYAFGDENLQNAKYPRGTVAMANSGPGTNGSQFLIFFKDTVLAPQYTPFGTVLSGLDIVDAAAARGSSPTGDGAPVAPFIINSANAVPVTR